MMEEPVVFRTKRVATLFNALGALVVCSVVVAGVLVGVPWWLSATLGGILLFAVATERYRICQRVEIDADGIRSQQFLGRARALPWREVTKIRSKGKRIELVGEQSSVRIYLQAGLEDDTRLLTLLAEHLPHLVHVELPPTVDDLDPPDFLPVVSRIRLRWLLFLLVFALPMGASLLVLGGVMALMVVHVERWWEGVLALLCGGWILALGALTLIWVVHEVAQKLHLDEAGVRLSSWWRGGYLPWNEVEDVTVGSGMVRVRGKGKSLSFMAGWFPPRERDAVQKVLQYYVVLHEIPVRRGQWLLP
jgi:hypothetical protein